MKRTYPLPAATFADPLLLSEIVAALAAGEESLVDRAFMELPDLQRQCQFDFNRSVACSLAATCDGGAWILFGLTGELDYPVDAAYTPFDSQVLQTQIETRLAEMGFRAIVGNAFVHAGFCEVMMDTEWSQIAKAMTAGLGVPEIAGEVLSDEARPTMILPIMVRLPDGESWIAGLADAWDSLSRFACAVTLPHLGSSSVAFRVDTAKLPREIACSRDRARMSRKLVPMLLENGIFADDMVGLNAWVMSTAGEQLEASNEFHTISVLIQNNFKAVARLDLSYEATPRMLMSAYRVLSLLGFKTQVLTAGTTQPVLPEEQQVFAQFMAGVRQA